MSTETVNSAVTVEAWWPRKHSAAALRLARIHAKVGPDPRAAQQEERTNG